MELDVLLRASEGKLNVSSQIAYEKSKPARWVKTCYLLISPPMLPESRMMRLVQIVMMILSLVGAVAFAEDSVGIRHEHAVLPSPESVLHDLNSSNDTVREKALFLIGLDHDQAETVVFEQNQTSGTAPKVIGRHVITIDIAELKYAALGEDTIQQAILSVQSGPMVFVAVALPSGTNWERVASFSCWCKYEKNPLREAVSLAPFGQSSEQLQFELVLRTSAGGTGVYSQQEGRYRVHERNLRQVLSFVSRYANGCTQGPMWCEHLERRWFVSTPVEGSIGGVLVEAAADVNTKEIPPIEYDIRELEDSHLRTIRCSTYTWDQKAFNYKPSTSSNSCRIARQNT